MTRQEILELIDRELHNLNNVSEATGLSVDETKRLESLVRSRKLALEQVEAEDPDTAEAAAPDFSLLLGGKH